MVPGISAINAVIPVGIYLHVELFSKLYQVFGIFGTVLEVNVVICHTVYKEQVTVQVVCTAEC